MRRARSLPLVVAPLIVVASSCAPSRVATPLRPGQEMVVLLAEPDGTLGAATVTTPSGTVSLASERGATYVSSGRAPTPPISLSERDAQRMFRDVLAALPPAPQRFTLTFRFESDELTDEGRAQIPAILGQLARSGAPDVLVVGHADTAGSVQVNFALGLKRAMAVRNLLTANGVDASVIEVVSHGELEPLIATADETLEPRNRRVEIAIR